MHLLTTTEQSHWLTVDCHCKYMRVNSTEAQCWRADIPDLMQIGSGMETPNSHEIILKDGRKENAQQT